MTIMRPMFGVGEKLLSNLMQILCTSTSQTSVGREQKVQIKIKWGQIKLGRPKTVKNKVEKNKHLDSFELTRNFSNLTLGLYC